MIAYLILSWNAKSGIVNRCVARLRERDPSCRIAVIDSPTFPLSTRPDCDLYRTRPFSGMAWEDERTALVTVARAFPGAHWIGRVENPGSLPVLPADPGQFDCWVCPEGYFVRRAFLPRLVRKEPSGGSLPNPQRGRIIERIIAAGGRVERGRDARSEAGYLTDPPLSPRLPMRAKAFCAVATANLIREAEILARTLRRHHDEPLVLVCDEAVERRIRNLNLRRIEIEPITAELREHSARISSRVIRHDPYWKPETIALKFHALRAAIQRHGPSHLLDADIVVSGSLHAGGPWMADLVLSPFFWPDPAAPTPVAHGFFNAGYVLARTTAIVDRWEEFYRMNVGGFYEQKCLEALGREFVTVWFGHEHNFAKWRWESPARRSVVSLHHKLRTKGKLRRFIDMGDAVTAAIRANDAPRRIAHVHCVRSWGTHLRCLFRERICAALGLQNLVSWDLGLQREWTEAELLLLAEGKLWGQHPGGCGFVHNHAFSWTEAALDAFRENGWLTVALVRDPREVLVSLASWSLDAVRRGQPCPVWHREGIDNSALAEAQTVEEAVTVLLTDPVYHPQWALPPWLGKVKWIRRAGPAAIEELCRDICGLPEVPNGEFRNASSSPGWDAAPLSAGVRGLVNAHPEVRAWDAFLATM